MSDLRKLFGNVHRKFDELPDGGAWHGAWRQQYDSAVYSERIRLAKHAGMAVMEMYRRNLCPRDIMTKEAILNALTVDMALGCSTNTMLHLPAIAHEIGFDFDIAFAGIRLVRRRRICVIWLRQVRHIWRISMRRAVFMQ